MAEYVTKIRTESGDKQIDYNALANLPKSDSTLSKSGEFADAKTTGDSIKNINQNVQSLNDGLQDLNEVVQNHTSSMVSTSSDGHMSADDKTKLDTIENGANNYILPTADNATIGGVTTTSDVTSDDGLTPCPIIDGVPYYNDVTLEKLGVDSTPEEINMLAGLLTVAERPISTQITLSTQNWNVNQQTIEVDGVTDNSLIFVAPAPYIDNYEAYNESGIRCVAQSMSQLTFEYLYKPDSNVVVNIVIFA